MTTHPGHSVPIGLALTRVAMATIALLLIPLVAMQFTREVDWTAGDFLVMGVLLFPLPARDMVGNPGSLFSPLSSLKIPGVLP